MFPFPNINPIAIDLGILQIRWYSLSYVVGIAIGWFLIIKIVKIKNLNINNKEISDLISNCIIGMIIGGRLGYVLFYNFEYYFSNMTEIFKIWNGGMSFHGGLIGIILASIYTSKTSKISLLLLGDLIALISPIGIFFGRIANFINGELYGRITNHKLGIIFPNGRNLPRHPSQLYEALLEGLILFIILWLLLCFTNIIKIRGFLTCCFVFFYGVFRFCLEFLREPDSQVGLLYFNLSMGQLLTLPMIFFGVAFFIIHFKKCFNV